MISARFAPMLFGLILSGLMSLIVSGLANYRVVGWSADLISLCIKAWIMAWLVAFPIVLIAAPLAKRLVAFATISK